MNKYSKPSKGQKQKTLDEMISSANAALKDKMKGRDFSKPRINKTRRK